MQTVTHPIERHSTLFYGGGQRAGKRWDYRAETRLYSGGRHVGTLFFHVSDHTLPFEDEFLEGTAIRSHYMAEEFERVMLVLQGPQPVYFRHLPGWNMAWLSTDENAREEPEEAPSSGAASPA